MIGLGATVGTWRVREPAPPAPAAPGASAVLPAEIFRPSPWLPGTDDLGPPGRLSVVMPAERGGWTGGRSSVVGISATTQEYRFLDLPDYAGGAVHSPDGLRVAWWTTGTPSGTVVWDTETPVTGYAAYDVATGEVTRREIETVHGLDQDDLVWVDDDRVLASYGQWQVGRDAPVREQGLAIDQRFETWRPGESALVLPGADHSTSFTSTPGNGRLLVSDREGVEALVDAVTGRVLSELDAGPYLSQGGVVVNPSGDRYAVQPGKAIPAVAAVGRVGRGQKVRTRIPDTKDVYGLVGWADDDTVVAVEGVPYLTPRAYLVRIHPDGTRTGTIALPDGNWQLVSVASDLLGAPIVAAREPATPMDPRRVVGLSGGIAVSAVVALVLWWRRRVRLGSPRRLRGLRRRPPSGAAAHGVPADRRPRRRRGPRPGRAGQGGAALVQDRRGPRALRQTHPGPREHQPVASPSLARDDGSTGCPSRRAGSWPTRSSSARTCAARC